MNHLRRHEYGFTLSEILVAVNVGFLMVSLGLMLFFGLTKSLQSWQKNIEAKDLVQSLGHRISLDIERSEAAVAYADTLLVLHRYEEAVEYRFVSGRVTRNGVSFGEDDQVFIAASISADPTSSGAFIVAATLRGSSGGYQYEQDLFVLTSSDSRSAFIKKGHLQ